jgi:hypothetical protein
VTYSLYLTEDGKESLVASDPDLRKIRRIVVGRSMARRLAKPGRFLRLTNGGKNMPLPALERAALDLWFEDQERECAHATV